MTLGEWIFAAVVLYLVTVAPVKAVGYKTFDNSNPRDPTFYKPGVASRALGAHLNGIDTFPFFALSVILAEFRHQPQLLVCWKVLTRLIIEIAQVLCASRSGNTNRPRALLG
jgi:uncharacterized MAPEG superfamily protein